MKWWPPMRQEKYNSVIVFNEQNKATDVVDDAYAGYRVPDDLVETSGGFTKRSIGCGLAA